MPLSSYPGGEISPLGVLLFDQPDLPRPLPFLDLFLARDGGFHGLMGFGVDQTMNLVLVREPLDAA